MIDAKQSIYLGHGEKYTHSVIGMLLAGSYLVFLSGRSHVTSQPVLTGTFYMLLNSERIDVMLRSADRMHERVSTENEAVHIIEGAWTINGEHIHLTPSAPRSSNELQLQSTWHTCAKYDSDGNLQVQAGENSTDHPYLLTRISPGELMFVNGEGSISFARTA